MKPVIIPISGYARHGKDSFAKLLKDHLELLGYKCLIINYANYLKFICKEYYSWNGEKDETGRTLLQLTGTEKIRTKNNNFWVDTVIEFIKVVEDDFDYVIIGDCRFQNEIFRWEDEGFKIIPIRVIRCNSNGSEFDNGLTEEQKNHSSEVSLDNFPFSWYAEAYDLNGLEEQVEIFIEEMIKGDE